MSDLSHVLVLAGGLSYEREVSLRSGRRVAEVLRAAGVDVEVRDTDAGLVPAVLADPPEAAFVALHGGVGEDGAIRSVLELLNVPYVGATPDACRVAFDKPTAKAVVRSWGLATPDSVALPKETFHDLGASAVLERIVDRLGLPLFVKPAQGGSALGASIVRTAEELPAAMVGCFAYGDTALIEKYIDGVEVSVSVIDLGDGPVALTPVEIVPDGGVYDYAARYTAGRTEFFAPARLTDEEIEACKAMAVTAHTALGLRDLSRTDIIVDRSGQPYFLEVNVSPGMTETSLFPMAVETAGRDLGTVFRVLLERAAQRG
ncbi:D-alanine--D-alanine ligase [Thermobispora bispora]|uniref:D-alanine--D-alanine ligase n=1 Tax=Thermobispora bispora (strain ATCC 19993 / DSM 43833 / CBS 139.67 / JCM 10125 / KCTC 9307 / NBRC 14880 / R51) TaxID=469371 RepID=D6YAL7_THEBD|nr:D-alanine--D-alanine ligase [Thermobispora bispora]ADG90270.1 D-alanine/D-alanine ligase [Thermobispora bispora DSM 43833]MBO2473327.1 D-alanine--D-alanine ligase [Actinomycetales bacterium]MDI9580788.1 D-alanine--D-alanine ligase [Thermobispora sp.]QSI46697.1 D-alanine--D-alanine ligase [Thermobispora bispora]